MTIAVPCRNPYDVQVSSYSMSKRAASLMENDIPEVSESGANGAEDGYPELGSADGSEYYKRQLIEWNRVQEQFNCAMNQPLYGMLKSGVNIEASFLRHRMNLMQLGYIFDACSHFMKKI